MVGASPRRSVRDGADVAPVDGQRGCLGLARSGVPGPGVLGDRGRADAVAGQLVGVAVADLRAGARWAAALGVEVGYVHPVGRDDAVCASAAGVAGLPGGVLPAAA